MWWTILEYISNILEYTCNLILHIDHFSMITLVKLNLTNFKTQNQRKIDLTTGFICYHNHITFMYTCSLREILSHVEVFLSNFMLSKCNNYTI